MSIFLFIY